MKECGKVLVVIMLFCLVIGGLILSSMPIKADDERFAYKVDDKKVDAVVKKGIEYLKSQQKDDGSWDYVDAPFVVNVAGGHMKQGCTALCAFALLKCGVDPKDPVIKKAFEYIRSQKLRYVYEVSCVILALEALYVVPTEKEKKKEIKKGQTDVYRKPAKRFKRRAPPWAKKLLLECVDFLVKTQQKDTGIWSYPTGRPGDASNSQYAMLALGAAWRLKVKVPKEVFGKAAAYFLKQQQKDGPEVKQFPVPAADHDIKKLKKIEKETRKKIAEAMKTPFGKDTPRTILRRAHEKTRVYEKVKVYARGWCYMPEGAANAPKGFAHLYTGSMTTSGVAALIISKAALEGNREYEKHRKKFNKAIRDGCGWLAHNFSVTANPGQTMHLYYYLYGLERVGMLGLVEYFGEHDWYKKGTEYILSHQKGNGSWDAGGAGTSGPVPDTCWALLFLKRATTPVVKLPEPPITSSGK